MPNPRRTDRAPGTRRLALSALCLAFLVIQLDATIVNVALSAMRRDLGGGRADQQWVVDAYTVVLAAGMLAAGSLGDRFGSRRICLLGLAVFAAASAGCAAAPDMAALLVARAVQGAGAAALLPCSLALIVRLFPDRRGRAHALGVWGGIGSLGLSAGPVLGGALVATEGWRTIFLVNLPCCALAMVLIMRYTRPATAAPARGADLGGMLLGTAALAALVGAFIEFGQRGGHPWLPVLLLVVSALTGAVFVRHEARTAEPMLPTRMLGDPRYSAALGAGFLFNFCLYGALLCLTLYLQDIERMSAWRTGLVVLPLTVAIGVGASVSGLLTARFGARPPMLLGYSCGGLGVLLLALGGVLGSPPLLRVGAVVLGCCSLAMPAMTSVAMSLAPRASGTATGPALDGLASGVLNTARQCGGALGVAVLGGLLGAPGEAELVAPMAMALAGYLVASGAAVVATTGDTGPVARRPVGRAGAR